MVNLLHLRAQALHAVEQQAAPRTLGTDEYLDTLKSAALAAIASYRSARSITAADAAVTRLEAALDPTTGPVVAVVHQACGTRTWWGPRQAERAIHDAAAIEWVADAEAPCLRLTRVTGVWLLALTPPADTTDRVAP
jgi:hypothetical protein